MVERRTPRPGLLLAGLVFLVLGGGAVLSELGSDVEPVGLVAAALVTGGAAALLLMLLPARPWGGGA